MGKAMVELLKKKK